MALARESIPSPFYSSRGGQAVRLLVVHTAEGALTIESLGGWFQNPSAQVSSHTGADDKANTVGEYVARGSKAWTQANANPYCASLELCGFAAWSPDEWHRHPNMLSNCAAWLAEESAAFGVPLVRLTASQAQGGGTGVCEHVDLGADGGGHTDCGTGFPLDEVLAMAGGTAPAPTPPPGEAAPPTGGGAAPPWPGRYLEYPPEMEGGDVRQWQSQMSARGWALVVDGWYGADSADTCAAFQREKGLGVDGVVGPETWAATWQAPVT